MAGSSATGMIDPHIFEDLQAKIDEDAQVKDQIRAILQILERQGRTAQSILSRAHSTPTSKRKQPRSSAVFRPIDSHWYSSAGHFLSRGCHQE
jgi:hypothetical protein